MKRKQGRPRRPKTKVAAFRVLKKKHGAFVQEVKPIHKRYK